MFYVMSKDLDNRVMCTTKLDQEAADDHADFLLSREYVVTVAVIPREGVLRCAPFGEPFDELSRLENEELS